MTLASDAVICCSPEVNIAGLKPISATISKALIERTIFRFITSYSIHDPVLGDPVRNGTP